MIDITHIHPMLVHFPIVLFIAAAIIQLILIFKSEDIAERKCLQIAGITCLVLGLIFAFAAAFFGDIALDAAIDKGFTEMPLEEHKDLAGMTIVIFAILTVILLGAMWKRFRIQGAKGIIFTLASVVGLVLLINTAYQGGNLVYKEGVNVEVVKSAKQL